MKKKIILLILLLIIPFKTNALVISSCSTSILSELKTLASNVNLSYDYEIRNNQAYFKITINNLNNKFYIIDSLGNKYTYSNSNNGEVITKEFSNIEKIKFSIYSNVTDCMNDLLATKYVNLPTYNSYYGSEVCKGVENYKLCQKWYKQTLDYDSFIYEVNKYKNKSTKVENTEEEIVSTKGLFDTIFEFYIKYYYIILPILIVVSLTIMYIKNRKNKFDL